MSLVDIRPYFSERIESKGFVEWQDAFASNNIPSTQIDNAFHQSFVSFSGGPTTQADQEIVALVQVDLFLKGFRDPGSKIQEAVERAEGIISVCMAYGNYKDSTSIKGVYFDSMTISPFSAEGNDNIVLATIVFEVRMFICIN